MPDRHLAMAKALIGGGILWVALLCLAAGASAGQAVADVFDRVHRSVVVIRTTELDVAENGGGPVKLTGLGSGVLVSTDGQVLTANHLVHAAFEIHAEFPDGARVRARVRAAARSADRALLQLDHVPGNAVVAPLADSDRARIGEQIFVVGAPHGFGHTLTVGYLSARLGPVPPLPEVSPWMRRDRGSCGAAAPSGRRRQRRWGSGAPGLVVPTMPALLKCRRSGCFRVTRSPGMRSAVLQSCASVSI